MTATNFIENDPNVVLQVDKSGYGMYSVDFKAPISPLIAFCTALCNLDNLANLCTNVCPQSMSSLG